MHIVIIENNLIWSSRLSKTAKALGHTVQIFDKIPAELPKGDVAILNLGSEHLCTEELVSRLNEAGFKTIGHAGHKEKPLLAHGESMGVHSVVSNSTLTFKLEEVLNSVSAN
jgi:hypothetical protein